MNMITMKDYADSKGISYEAVRRQVQRYSEELKGHITVQNRTQYLDEWAVDFLSERRRQSPIVVIKEDQSEEIDILKQQVESLKSVLEQSKAEVMSLREKDISSQYELIDLKKKMLLLEAKEEEQKETAQRLKEVETELIRANLQTEAAQQRMEVLQNERDQAVAEANSFQKSIFGFYRRRSS